MTHRISHPYLQTILSATVANRYTSRVSNDSLPVIYVKLSSTRNSFVLSSIIKARNNLPVVFGSVISFYHFISCIVNMNNKCDISHLILYRFNISRASVNPLTAKLFNLNFHPLEVVSRWRDPQLQVSENYSYLTKWRSTLIKSCWLMSHFIFNIFKMWYLMC